MKARKPLLITAAVAVGVVVLFIAHRSTLRVLPGNSTPAPAPSTPRIVSASGSAALPSSRSEAPAATQVATPVVRLPSLSPEAAQLLELTPPILQQKMAAQQRIDAFAAASGDFKDVIPVQAKRYQESEAVLTLIAILRDPNWSPMFLDYIQHRHGLEYMQEWLKYLETSLGVDAGLSTARDARELQALLLRAEPRFQQRSAEIAAKFQLDVTLATDVREVAMLDTLQKFVKAYRYWVINKNREE